MPSRSRPAGRASVVEPARKQVILPKFTMDIHIANHYRSKVYTTFSTVSGHVEVNVSHDTDFDAVEIFLVGTSKTSIDAVNIPLATSHTFLKLIMPVPESYYPVPRRFKAGTNYTIPFHFVIPQHLTLNACSHCAPNHALKDNHLHLPPSVGDWQQDDFAPLMSRITYSVRARVVQNGAGIRSVRLMDKSCDIKVLPTTTEEPPLSIDKQDKMYAMSKCKTLRKSIISPKMGNITVAASQPASAMVSPDGRWIMPTTAHLDFVFEPASSESLPPKITAVSSKVAAVTFYSSGGINQYPNLKDWPRAYGADGRGMYTTTVSLPSTSVVDSQWKQQPREQARRDSGYCSDPGNAAEGMRVPMPDNRRRKQNKKSAPFRYTTQVRVPVTLPAGKKTFLPTFHSCITSRVYVLWLTVTLSVPGGTATHVTLRVPLQIGISSQDSPGADASGLPTFEAAMEDSSLDVDSFFQPRTMSVPDIDFQSELPGYGMHAGSRARAVTRRAEALSSPA
ncbi:arrestin [Poronia punctata]|nr:arrestin [Poronia punctata]